MNTTPDAVGFSTCREAIMRKVHESADTAIKFFDQYAEQLDRLAAHMASAFSAGHRLFTLGNGGSACDAEHISVEFMHPIFEKRKPLPCIPLTTQSALLSALSNDLDFSAVFAAQLSQLAGRGDMALAVSTSGMSSNLVKGLQEARKIGLTTIAFSGKDGGRLSGMADWDFIVPSYSIHRIQESHTILLHVLWDLVHIKLGEEDIV